MTERTRTVGYVKRTQVTLAQTVYAVVHPDNVETLDVDVEVSVLALLHVWTSRRLYVNTSA